MRTEAIKLCCQLTLTTLLFLLLAGIARAETRVKIIGVEGELRSNIELLIGPPPPANDARKLKYFLADIPALSTTALSALGYYGAKVAVTTSAVENDTIITVNVQRGDPVRVRNINIQLNGDAGNDPAYRQILEELPVRIGEIFVSDDYESTKSQLLNKALSLGYFQFAFTESSVSVSRRQLTADITLIANSGPRYSFGDIIFEQDIFRPSFLERWLPFSKGEPYESSLTGELAQNLRKSGYFQSVRVVPLQDSRYGTEVPIRVWLVPRDNNEISVGVGYATDIGPRTTLAWDKPLINRLGHSAKTKLGLAKEQQNLSLSYRIPRSKEPLFNYWAVDYGLLNDATGDTGFFLTTLNFQRVSRTKSQWIESLFLRWERETFTVNNVEQSTDLVLPGFSYERSRSRGEPFPTWGQSTSLQVMGGSKDALSTIDLIKATAKFRYLRAISNRNTLIGTLEYGVLQSNDYDRVPISQRFFAGGDRSVRGFRYKDISPINDKKEAVGGRYLEVINLEYNYRFLDNWSAALFTDAGRVFNKFSNARYSIGAGFGVRWKSPVGPFRIDIATPISSQDRNGSIRVHLSLGPEF